MKKLMEWIDNIDPIIKWGLIAAVLATILLMLLFTFYGQENHNDISSRTNLKIEGTR